jgi:hypothetical protein
MASERLIQAAAKQFDPARPGEAAVPQNMLVREAVATLGWGTMAYRCEACGFEWDIWLALGVEGPPSLREHGLYVASPFTLSRCPAWPFKPDVPDGAPFSYDHLTQCDGRMSHVRFQDDREFSPCLIPDDAPRFVLDHFDGAHLVIPEAALVAARRFHADREVPDA